MIVSTKTAHPSDNKEYEQERYMLHLIRKNRSFLYQCQDLIQCETN